MRETLVKRRDSPNLSVTSIRPFRWATHGAVCDQNAHPQSSDKGNQFVVVHNGTIENHRELRQIIQVSTNHILESTDMSKKVEG